MRIIRKLFFVSLVVGLAWLSIYVYNRATDGFSLHQMTSSLPPCPQFEVPLSPEKKEELQAKLQQPFRYIGKGCQFYVFSSQDNTCVIKFLKHKHLRPFTWLHKLPLPSKIHALADAKIARRELRVERLFSSCKLAYEKMPEETGLLFIHLNRTPALSEQITLIDKIGRKHLVNLDDYEYVIQKKALPLKELYAHLTPEQVPIKAALLGELVLRRCQKGICDRDRSFAQNVAFTLDGTQPLFVDIGQFYEDPAMLDPDRQAHEVARRLTSLSLWTAEKFPSLSFAQ